MMKSHKLRESHMLRSLIFGTIFFWEITEVTPITLVGLIIITRPIGLTFNEITQVT